MSKRERQGWSKHRGWLKYGASACAAVFVLNLLLGKAGIVFGWKLSFLFDGASEFVLLLATVTLFVVYTLLLEWERDTKKTKLDI
jgi:hypothetical protein